MDSTFQIFFYVHPYLRKWSNLTNIFQMGWFNHQPVIYLASIHLNSLRGERCEHFMTKNGPPEGSSVGRPTRCGPNSWFMGLKYNHRTTGLSHLVSAVRIMESYEKVAKKLKPHHVFSRDLALYSANVVYLIKWISCIHFWATFIATFYRPVGHPKMWWVKSKGNPLKMLLDMVKMWRRPRALFQRIVFSSTAMLQWTAQMSFFVKRYLLNTPLKITNPWFFGVWYPERVLWLYERIWPNLIGPTNAPT